MEQVILPLRSDEKRVWVSRVSRERDHPLEATSSEEVNAAFVPLLSAACLVIIRLYVKTDWTFQKRSQPASPRKSAQHTINKDELLTVPPRCQIGRESANISKYMKLSLVWHDEQSSAVLFVIVACLDRDTVKLR